MQVADGASVDKKFVTTVSDFVMNNYPPVNFWAAIHSIV